MRELVRLARRLPKSDSGGHNHIQGPGPGGKRDRQPAVRRRMDVVGRPCGLATEEQGVAGAELVVLKKSRRAGREQYETPSLPLLIGLECGPAIVADDIGPSAVVHGGALQVSMGQGEATGLYDIDRNAKTGGQTDSRPQILGDVGL